MKSRWLGIVLSAALCGISFDAYCGGMGGGAPGARAGAATSPLAAKVENRTYLFTDTNENLPYCLFVSSKVKKDEKAPMIVTLHGMGGTPSIMMNAAALELAEEGGYILVAPMGYNTNGWFGVNFSMGGMGARGARGARGATTQPARGAGMGGGAPSTQPARGGGMGGMGGGMGGMGGGMGGMGGAMGARGAATQPARGGGAPGARGMMGGGGGGGGGGTAVTDETKVHELSEKDVLNVMEIIKKEYKVDENRIYVMGHSMGGAGAIYFAEKYPTTFAAMAALAPAAFTLQPADIAKVKDMPILFAHGDADTVVSPSVSQGFADKAKDLKLNYEHVIVPGGDHGTIITQGQALAFKLFAKSKKSDK